MPSEKANLLTGELYQANDPALVAERLRAKRLSHRYNQQPVELDKQVLAKPFSDETDARIEASLRYDYSHNIQLGRNFLRQLQPHDSELRARHHR